MSVSPQERKAALDLFPYFNQKHPVVFDVGSNKGQWSDIFVHNVAEMHLFEPNKMLLHYTMAKYDYLRNVRYYPVIIKDTCDSVEFVYFTDEHNGLSNIFDNPQWRSLPNQKKDKAPAQTLDAITAGHEKIDFLKVDVEGAEMLVMKGAKSSLHNRSFRFIQVERADHIKLSGYQFSELIGYLDSFGYVPMQTEDTENVIFAMEGFTQDWNSEFKKNTKGLKFDFALEIGCFEGLTSRYICDNLLNPGGRIICVDPLTDEYLPGHEDNHMFVGQYERFTRNTRNYPIELIRKKSIDSFAEMEHYRFDFVYIDGDHRRYAVFDDAINSFRLTKIGGHILFDDYEWRPETKAGIDEFLNIYEGRYELLTKGYQVLIKKIQDL